MLKEKGFAYLLRYAVDPEEGTDAALEMLYAFVTDALIDDVSLFTEGEELSRGHMTPARQRVYAGLFAQARSRLRAIHAGFSINHWTTFYHADRGRALAPGQAFRRMVDPYGREADVTVCPLCPSFRSYYLDLIRRFGELSPTIFWVEDDFRFHNHAPLAWGGCFCEAHMAEYRRRAGEVFTREAFVRAVTAPGAPHRYRKVFLDTCRDTLRDFARAMRAAMDEVSPQTRLGLMSSDPSVHCAEGRDWHALLGALSGATPPTHRIHLPSYLERTPQEYLWLFNTISMPCRAAGPANAEIFPELENFPFSPATKSLAFERFQIELSLALNAHGITLDLFDICATGIHPDDGHAKNLRAMKPFLAACSSGALDGERLGVQILFSSESSYTLHAHKDTMDALYPRETFWGGALGALGVPFAFRQDPENLAGQIVAVSGQYFRNLTGEAIRGLFTRNYLLLDGEAADTLCQMGLGALAGLRSVRRVPHENGQVCYEQSVAQEKGFAVPRAGAQVFLGDAYLIDYLPGARAVSRLMRYDRETAGPGLAVFNERVMVFPFCCAEYPGSLFHRLRQLLIGRELARAARRFALPVMGDSQCLCLYAFAHDDGLALLLANASADALGGVRLRLTGSIPGSARVQMNGEWSMLPAHREGESILLPLALPPMRCALMILCGGG